MAAELDGSGNLVKQFIYVDGVNSPDYMIYQGKKFLFSKDHRGSITMVVDSATGEIKQKIKYSDWGEVLEDTSPGLIPFGYAGGMYDQDTKLIRFGARDYDPQIGRWLSKDPIRFDGGDTNLYGYVGQEPINFFDPEGTYHKRADGGSGGGNRSDNTGGGWGSGTGGGMSRPPSMQNNGGNAKLNAVTTLAAFAAMALTYKSCSDDGGRYLLDKILNENQPDNMSMENR